MDWVIDAGDRAAVRAVRNEIGSYLRRHGEPDGDFNGAELVASELLTNAVTHTQGPIWATLAWGSEHPLLRVIDLGDGFDLRAELPDAVDAISGRGLFIVGRFARQLESHRRRLGGTETTAELPVSRALSASIDPPRRRTGVLPGMEEADPETGFGKEAFLRALVVMLAESVAVQQGPEAAEAAIAQVAADVGGRMEEEYRQATQVMGRLTSSQLAACFVRLKSAIDGDFSVVEITDDRIVLENTRCPFGDAVRRSPALCRMTSAVFGGIAARNSEGAVDVELEERIALGDSGCRVVIQLDPPAEPAPWAHRYQAPD